MASSSSSPRYDSQDQDLQQQPPPLKDVFYKTKSIRFLDRTVPIVLQNDNGSCPLLAIC
ncbi:protein FAM63B-like [Trifolium pratense]|uniref:Protein FAM63B-like n=1 Tax=Trifolium pratense TaxID=57577 RepID=A0A2K3KIC1_TRIPR|nr:protein FAM63B-like [Trifolium pratense]